MPPNGKEFVLGLSEAAPFFGVVYFFAEVDNLGEREGKIETLKDRYPEGKMSCTEARRLAEELSIPLAEMGELCDDAKIKIKQCELGCF